MVSIFNIILIEDFAPIINQYFSIIKLEKNYTTKKIVNELIPWYFHSCCIALPFVYNLLMIIPLYWYHLITVLLPFCTLLLVYIAPSYNKTLNDKSLNNILSIILIIAAYITSSISEIMKSTIRLITKPSRSESQNIFLQILKAQSDAIRSLAAWIAQDLYFETGGSQLIFFYSLIIYIIAIVMALTQNNSTCDNKITEHFNLIGWYIKLIKGFNQLQSREKISFLFQILVSMFRLFLGLFANGILFEISENSKKTLIVNNEYYPSYIIKIINIIKLINLVIYKIINLLTKFLLFITCTIPQNKKKDILGVGYVIGIVKIFSSILGIVTTKWCKSQGFDFYNLGFCIFPLILITFICFIYAPTTKIGNVLYFLLNYLLSITDTFIKPDYINGNFKNYKQVFACTNLFTIGFISSLINIMSGILKTSVRRKSLMYWSIGLICYINLLIAKKISNT